MKKGFTLVELLAVIIILGILGLIVVPMVNETIKEQKEKLYNRQIETLESSAEAWSTKNTDKLVEDGTSIYVSITTLVQDGYLKNSDIKDPRNNKQMLGCVSISYDISYNQYVYEYVDANEDTYNNECVNAY